MKIFLTIKTWKEGKHYVSYTPELDVTSQGKTPEHAEKRLQEAVDIFFEEIKKMGTLNEVLNSLGILRKENRIILPKILFSGLEIKI